MGTALISSFISGAIAIISIAISTYNQNRINKLNESLDVSRKHQYYIEPLIRSASDLQSRIYNILELGFIEEFYHNGNKRQQDYVINNTVFLFSQFFAWTEAARIDIQYLSLEKNKKMREFIRLQNNINSLIQTDVFGQYFMFFIGEQRAIAEKMLISTDTGFDCIGYGSFTKENCFINEPFFLDLNNEVINMTRDIGIYKERLIRIQHALIDLINFLDPGMIRFDGKKYGKI
ncbi:TPA: lysogenic protein [Escherichia coli]